MLSEVTAIADYAATQPDEISFKAGASIKVLKKDGDWWTGSLASDPSVAGVFPSNFVEAAGPVAPDGSTAESALGAFEGEILAAHNEFRAGHGPQCGALAWSDALAAEAKASAEMLATAGLAVGQPSAAGQPDGENVVVLPGDPSLAGLLTQGGQGGRPAPLASRFHRIPTRFPLNLHAIDCKSPFVGPPVADRELSPQVPYADAHWICGGCVQAAKRCRRHQKTLY